MKLLRPFSITAGTLILLGVWVWIDMSNTQYRAGYAGGGRTTAGWFVLGSPFLLGFGLLASLLFAWVVRRTRPVVGWACLLAVFIPLIGIASANTAPAARVRTALEVAPPPETRIQRVDQSDSFNDGGTISGVCSAGPQFVQILISAHALKTSNSGVLHQMMPDEPIPQDADVLEGNELTIFYDADRSLLYFFRRLGQNR